jgi:chromosome segregation ATPase
MLESILAVDSLAIQRSLMILEDRYRELREIGEKRFEAWEQEKAAAQQSATELKQQLTAQAETLQQTQTARDEQAARVKGLEGELATLKGERDVAAKEKAAAQQSATELKQQLTAQAETLQQTQTARDEQAARVKGLEGDLATLNTQQSSVAAGLQRLRHLAHPAGKTT